MVFFHIFSRTSILELAIEVADVFVSRPDALSVTDLANPLSLFGNISIIAINAITAAAASVPSSHFFRIVGTKIKTRTAVPSKMAIPDNHDDLVSESINETKMPVTANAE